MYASDPDRLLDEWLDNLRSKQETLHNVYGIGNYARYDRDGDAGVIRFSDTDDGAILVADTTDIGSYSTATRTWMWSWANECVAQAARVKSARLQMLAEITGLRLFREAVFDSSEAMAWKLAAAGVHYLAAMGCYRAPCDGLWVFLAIDQLHREHPSA